MIFSFFRRDAQSEAILSLYNKVVAQARLPCFYRDYAVADTVNGRFDLIVPHVALVLERLMTAHRRRPHARSGVAGPPRCKNMI
jgi:cytochrome b pre-mRNA-processing protein 3